MCSRLVEQAYNNIIDMMIATVLRGTKRSWRHALKNLNPLLHPASYLAIIASELSIACMWAVCGLLIIIETGISLCEPIFNAHNTAM